MRHAAILLTTRLLEVAAVIASVVLAFGIILPSLLWLSATLWRVTVGAIVRAIAG